MPSLYQLKPAFQRLLQPAAVFLDARSVTANHVTLLAAALSVVYGGCLGLFANWPVLWGSLPVFLVLRMALNALDGMLARDFGHQSTYGAFLNELGDIVSDSALILGFAGLGPTLFLPSALFALTAALTEAAGLCAQAVCGTRRYDGPMGKSDRAFALGLAGLLLGLGWIGISLVAEIFMLATLAAGVTVVQRVRSALRVGA